MEFLLHFLLALFSSDDGAESRRASPWKVGSTITASPVQVIDGDTLRFTGRNGKMTSVRIAATDAPEYNQNCPGQDGEIPCGAIATRYMRNLVGGSERDCPPRAHGICLENAPVLRCTVQAIDRYQRPVARCQRDGTDLGEEMVSAGMARSSYGDAYRFNQWTARLRSRGFWQYGFPDPADFRHNKS